MLDFDKLEKVRHRHGKTECACPACREAGKDKAGDNLAIFTSGKFTCIADSTHAHRQRIWELVGVREEPTRYNPRTIVRRPSAPPPPPRQVRPFPALRKLTVGEMARIAEARRWPMFAGLQLLSDRGLLWHANIRGHDAWLIADKARRNAQARRVDCLPWWGDVKPYSLAKHMEAFAHNWPIGAADIGDRPEVWICEGQPDFCAALLVAWWGRLDVKNIAPVCMTGAGISAIHPDALKYFIGKKVFIPADKDRVGQEAAHRWAEQLLEAGASSVEGLDVGAGNKDLADFATTLQLTEDNAEG